MKKFISILPELFALFFMLFFFFAISSAIKDSNIYYQEKEDIFLLEGYSDNFCKKYYSNYTTKNLPVGCLKHFN